MPRQAGRRPGLTSRSASIPGFNDGGAGGLKTFTFASPITLTSDTRYAFIFRLNAPPAGGNTVAYTCSCQTTGFQNSNPYASGQFVTSSNSGANWAADPTSGGRDLNFITYINPGFAPTGTFVSSLKDANPAAGNTATWTTLTFSDTTPAGTSVKFKVAASSSASGPFSFVGPDGTAATFFTTSGASLSQFNGFRYLRYQAILATSDGLVTPKPGGAFRSALTTSVASPRRRLMLRLPPVRTPAPHRSRPRSLRAATGVSGKTVSFMLNGSSAGSATTDGSGVATLSNVSLAGITAGSYPTGVSASFAGDGSFSASSSADVLTVNPADQASASPPCPSERRLRLELHRRRDRWRPNAVTFSSSGACSNVGAT